jgi:general secretion pathway protein G
MMRLQKNAFTMIELIFVIVILGILAAVAIPKFAQSKTQADVAKGRSDVATIRTAIMNERQKRLLSGDTSFISGTTLNSGGLFGGVLTYPETDSTSDGHWSKIADDANKSTYYFHVGGEDVLFTYYKNETTVGTTTYKAGTFTCDANKDGNASQKYCYQLTK